ncbi:MAG: hypothetical protein MK137_01660 [Rickettsiales bacterium]|nr:hypothetical protein [Rickettsiales bacterium]
MTKHWLVIVLLVLLGACSHKEKVAPSDSLAMQYVNENRAEEERITANEALKIRKTENHSARSRIPESDEVTPQEKRMQDSLLALSIIRVLITPLPLVGF